MKKIAQLIVLLLVALTAKAQITNPVTWSFSIDNAAADTFQLTAKAKIEPYFHIYSINMPQTAPMPTTFFFDESSDYEAIGEVRELTKPQHVNDTIFGTEYDEFSKEAVFSQTFKRLNDNEFQIKGGISYQACKDGGMCIPLDEDISVICPKNDGTASTPATAKTNIWQLIIEAILWGFAAILTPCVFPMIPMTVSFFMHGSESKAAGRFKAIMYFLFIVLLYTVPIALIILITWLFGGNSVTADIFNWLATHWLPNILFFIVFMVFAASFFGAFDINLSNKWVNDSSSKRTKAGLGGIFFMALTLVLVSFACTGPIVGTVLIKSTSGEFWAPILTIFAFSVAFALPFALCALFPGLLSRLPKSGSWLNSVKVVLGFIEVALGFKFLSVADQTYHWHLLDREVYLAIWIVCFTLCGLYLLGKIRFAHDDEEVKQLSVFRLVLVIIDFTFVVYMIPGMWGAPLKALSGYLPPKQTLDFDLERMISERNASTVTLQNAAQQMPSSEIKYSDLFHLPHGLKGYFDYDQAIEASKSQHKPIFLDFTGHGCVNCREMEANVWKDPRVLKMLNDDYIILALYVDDKTPLPESEQYVSSYDGKLKKDIGRKNADFQMSHFNNNAQPYYCLLSSDGELLVEPRAYSLDKDGFVEFLKTGLARYSEKTVLATE